MADNRSNAQELRLCHDDNLIDVIDKVNAALKESGLVFEDDGKEHDGYCIYRLTKTSP